MIKNIVGAVIGAKLAGKSPNVDNAAGATTGALAASVIPLVISRLSIPAMLAIGVGGYVLKRYADKMDGRDQAPNSADRSNDDTSG